MLVALGDNLRVTEGDARALEAYTEGTRRSPTFFRKRIICRLSIESIVISHAHSDLLLHDFQFTV